MTTTTTLFCSTLRILALFLPDFRALWTRRKKTHVCICNKWISWPEMNENSVRTNLENSCSTFALDKDSYSYIKQLKIRQNINFIYTSIQYDGQDREINFWQWMWWVLPTSFVLWPLFPIISANATSHCYQLSVRSNWNWAVCCGENAAQMLHIFTC